MRRQSDPESLDSRNSGFLGSALDGSNKSYYSYDTVPTDYSTSTRPPFPHHDTCGGRLEHSRDLETTRYAQQHYVAEMPRSSVETYASTVDFDDGYAEDELEYQVPTGEPWRSHGSDALPATPADFAELFPSSRQLSIKHDDSTDDGNMNLRLDTTVDLADGRYQNITLFHLRMHDLRKREFSLRRYCRNSGREVCHSVRRYQESSVGSRPGLGRSLSNAFAAIRSMSDSKAANNAHLKRSDSGYGSIASRQSLEWGQAPASLDASHSRMHPQIPTNTTKLEFSNYSQVEVKRRGTKQSKRYEFEYWGKSYAWKRVITRYTSTVRTSYHLYRANDARILASIEPENLSAGQAYEERRKGGWIPPCSMSIDDQEILQDQSETADVVIASGLVALVDDCIKQHFHPTPKRQFVIPIPKLRLDVDYIGTKDLFKEMIHRSSSNEAGNHRHMLRNGGHAL